ncbi:MAG: RNA-binding protein [Sphingobacteriales bacterium SCN 48-20]|jgi:RNA recognition motif-containing protein|uniref:RNA recognition motif domain-containing protein n=1 Tax=Terrimonas ferruginea TaxID=249 RepID=UPI000424C227|nr:RNA-binding protein [Terrimonas ferruginea]MBN8785204.1 RNA-binding protein [Terrimonas ferruginea]ODT90451.1 MAG: RNA-binding protein [Sphingobacteriales bacterium SCN 48-20]OJW41202.1 MAG: RNA-binding protein [Sphingobacteriales bacterium 48-107]
MNMYVSNLGFHVQDEELKQLFAAFGEVTSARVIKDKLTGRSRGFAFVEMTSEDEAQTAMKSLNNKEVEGRPLSISVAREKESSPRRNNW